MRLGVVRRTAYWPCVRRCCHRRLGTRPDARNVNKRSSTVRQGDIKHNTDAKHDTKAFIQKCQPRKINHQRATCWSLLNRTKLVSKSQMLTRKKVFSVSNLLHSLTDTFISKQHPHQTMGPQLSRKGHKTLSLKLPLIYISFLSWWT